MPNKPHDPTLTYRLTLSDEKKLEYFFGEEDGKITLTKLENLSPDSWMILEHEQCTNCPLNIEENMLCPIAENLSVLLKDWHDIVSYDEVLLEVITEQRTITAETTAQKALSSLLGLLMATSECPHTQFFRPMAQFHLPLSTAGETSFRAISTHLITQLFRHQNREDISFNLDGLVEVYDNMHIVNTCLKKRIESAVEQDAAINAVVLLDLFAITFPNYLEDELDNLKQHFSILINK